MFVPDRRIVTVDMFGCPFEGILYSWVKAKSGWLCFWQNYEDLYRVRGVYCGKLNFCKRKMDTILWQPIVFIVGGPNGTRTRVFGVRGNPKLIRFWIWRQGIRWFNNNLREA